MNRSKSARCAAVALVVAAAWWASGPYRDRAAGWCDAVADALEHLHDLGGDALTLRREIRHRWEELWAAHWIEGAPRPRLHAAVDAVALDLEQLHAALGED